jgi:hypothetical protein
MLTSLFAMAYSPMASGQHLVYSCSRSLWGKPVAAFSFSSFRRTQAIFEVRFEAAYVLWDRSGLIWKSVGRNFKKLRHQNITPNQMTFFGDDRFSMAVELERASITDHRPQGGIDGTIEVLAAFGEQVIEILDVKALTRVGNRYQYSIECKSLEEARRKAQATIPYAVPKKKLFSIEPAQIGPNLKIEGDDGELAYLAQIYHREQKVELAPPPEYVTLGLERVEKIKYELTLDIDFFTKKSIPVERFQAKSWLLGWHKTIVRDADAFLDLAEGRQ